MEVIIRPTTAEAVNLTAKLIADAIRRKPFFKLGLATGATMEAVYADLAAMNKAGEVDFSRVVTFNLDEYIGLPPEDPNSYRYYMNKHLFSKINIDRLKRDSAMRPPSRMRAASTCSSSESATTVTSASMSRSPRLQAAPAPRR